MVENQQNKKIFHEYCMNENKEGRKNEETCGKYDRKEDEEEEEEADNEME